MRLDGMEYSMNCLRFSTLFSHAAACEVFDVFGKYTAYKSDEKLYNVDCKTKKKGFYIHLSSE